LLKGHGETYEVNGEALNEAFEKHLKTELNFVSL